MLWWQWPGLPLWLSCYTWLWYCVVWQPPFGAENSPVVKSDPAWRGGAAFCCFLLCCATSAEPTCPQSPSAGSHPYCCWRSYATCWPASPCVAGWGRWGGHRLTVNRITGGLRCQRSAPLHSLASALSASHICCSVQWLGERWLTPALPGWWPTGTHRMMAH